MIQYCMQGRNATRRRCESRIVISERQHPTITPSNGRVLFYYSANVEPGEGGLRPPLRYAQPPRRRKAPPASLTRRYRGASPPGSDFAPLRLRSPRRRYAPPAPLTRRIRSSSSRTLRPARAAKPHLLNCPAPYKSGSLRALASAATRQCQCPPLQNPTTIVANKSAPAPLRAKGAEGRSQFVCFSGAVAPRNS